MELKIGRVLSNIVKQRRLTLKEISKATGVAATTLSEWQSNRAPRNPTHLLKVARYLDVSVHFLLFGEEDQTEPLQRLLKNEIFTGTFEISIKRVQINTKDKGNK